ncbi:hypothetical protein [Variovorax sp. JS1663]|uniref:hypothetical protein n=1 Tax=Variovorax sp. JS1663 TaxID=1851577 RepID=UPI000B341183|nr:hypothetical protein [Variovorax sp. JS1663]OUL98771.1 hypothetical protein A8M77_29965 [Variovorax sp. JS1663]
MTDLLMPHPDGSGRLIPHVLYASLKPQYDARRAEFESGLGRHLETEAGRAAAREAFMEKTPVDRVEIAAPAGKFIDPSLTDARVDARVIGELDGKVNKTGGVDFDVPASNVFGLPSITPRGFFSG